MTASGVLKTSCMSIARSEGVISVLPVSIRENQRSATLEAVLDTMKTVEATHVDQDGRAAVPAMPAAEREKVGSEGESSVSLETAAGAAEQKQGVGNPENTPSSIRTIDEIRTWRFVRLLLSPDLIHEEDYMNGNLLIEYDLSSKEAIMEVAEPKRRYSNRLWSFTINGHIQFRASGQCEKRPYVRSCTFSLHSRKSYCIFYTNYNCDRKPRHVECTCSLHAYVLSMYVRAT
jgi:hypothetical protein